jgi:hypothetical protein
MTHLQLTPEHPPTGTKADRAADEMSRDGHSPHQEASHLQQVELDRASGEGMLAPADEELTQPADQPDADRWQQTNAGEDG